MITTVNLKETLDRCSLNFLEENYEMRKDMMSVYFFSGESYIEFHPNDKAIYNPTGKISDVIKFTSHQDCVDFIRVK